MKYLGEFLILYKTKFLDYEPNAIDFRFRPTRLALLKKVDDLFVIEVFILKVENLIFYGKNQFIYKNPTTMFTGNNLFIQADL